MVKNVIQRPQQFQIYKNHLFKEASYANIQLFSVIVYDKLVSIFYMLMFPQI